MIGGSVMGLLQAYRDAGETVRRERDERVEVARLRAQRVEYGVGMSVLFVGVCAVLVWPSLTDHQRVEGLVWVLCVMAVALAVAAVVGRTRYGSESPELRRAEQIRRLPLIPVQGCMIWVLIWLQMGEAVAAWTSSVMFVVIMTVGTVARLRLSDDEGESGPQSRVIPGRNA